MNAIVLYRLSIIFATIPLIVGAILFLTWYIPRSLYAIDYPMLKRLAIYCYFIFIIGLIIALMLLILWCIRGKSYIDIKVLVAVGVFIFSYFLGQRLAEFGRMQQTKVFVRIDNHTGQDLLIQLYPYFGNRMKQFLTKNDSREMFIYQPEYNIENGSIQLKKTYLEIRGDMKKNKLTLPIIEEGSCRRFTLDQHFVLKEY